MPSGNEIVIGFDYPKWSIIEEALAFKMPRPVEGDPFGFADYEQGHFEDMSEEDGIQEYWGNIDTWELMRPVKESVSDQLLEAWHKACVDMGWILKKEMGNHFVYITSEGDRKFSPFSLELYYDPGEMGDSPFQAFIGVSISSRYQPTFLDWRDPNGTIYNQVIGPKYPQEMIIAHNRICEAVPCFASADWIIREIWY